MLSLKKDTAPPIPARGIMKLRINKRSSRSLEKLGCSYVDNEMLEEDAAAAAWMRRNRNCDLFMKRVDPSLEGMLTQYMRKLVRRIRRPTSLVSITKAVYTCRMGQFGMVTNY